MNKVSAQKIRSLEMRIARLEREAGFIDDMVDVFKKTLNIPKNMFLKIIYAFKEIYDDIIVWNTESYSKAMDSLGALLGARIFRAMAGVITTSDGLPKIVKFNGDNPLNSTFTGGLAGKSNMPLKQLIDMYEGLNKKKMKAAYLSWYSDYKDALNPEVGDKEALDAFLSIMKRGAKWVYRLLTSLLSLIGLATLKGTVIWNIIVMIAQRYVQVGLLTRGNIGDGASKLLQMKEVQVQTINIERVVEIEQKGLIESAEKFIYDVTRRGDYHQFYEKETVVSFIKESPINQYQPVELVKTSDITKYLSKEYLSFAGVIATSVLALLESAMYKWVIKTDEYEEMKEQSDAMGKTASQYPALSYITMKLERVAFA